MMGLKGCPEGLLVSPNLPSDWNEASCTRKFRGATFNVKYIKATDGKTSVEVDGSQITGNVITGVEAGVTYEVTVTF